MSTAFYPQGMRSFQSGGYRNSTLPSQYVSWKGSGPFSNPIGTAPSHIRPLTNLDSGNVFLSGSFPSRTYFRTRVFIPRPIKHYRKGRVIPSTPIEPVQPDNHVDVAETKLINYNMNRFVKSSKGTSLGGGHGGRGLLNEMQDNPGSYSIKQNQPTEQSNILESDINCKSCEGVGIVASYYPNNTYLTENPEPNTQNPVLCCNDEYKARRRAIYASTNLKKNYYTTTKQYLQNRCQTFEQKSFNFQQPNPVIKKEMLDNGVTAKEILLAKPGSALATFNTYLANCFPNAEIYDATESALLAKLLNILLNKGILTQTQVSQFEALNSFNFDTLFEYLNGLSNETKTAAVTEFVAFVKNPYYGVPFSGPSNPNGCKLTVYKPNNPQYAVQGAVSSSTRLLKLNVDTISTNAASIQHNNNTGSQLITANEIYRGNDNNVANYFKNKAPNCNSPTVFQFQNKKLCHYKKQLPEYQVPISQPSPYRYYIGTIRSSNHFSQSPNTYNTPSRSY
jgi:hypothetical protein